MRSTSALYRFACEEEGCVSHTELVKLFHGVDVALQATAPPPASQDGATFDDDDDADEVAQLSPPPPALTDALLIAFSPNLRYPTHIFLSTTYLGDAGAAAFFRVLPMLRWLRVVDARGIGAGSRSMVALCDGLTAYLVDGCEEAPALPAQAVESSCCHEDDTAPHPLAGRLPALELVDLRDNDAIFTLAVERLLAVLPRRRAALLRWCAKHGETAAESVLLPALTVYVTPENLLPSTARSLQAWNEAAAAVTQRRAVAVAERRWQEQLRVFTTAREGAESVAPGQPVGEHVVFRLPVSEDETQATDALCASINANMHHFLTASCLLAPSSEAAVKASPYAAGEGAYAALQAAVDFGADALEILLHSNAALWYAARLQQQQQQQQQEGLPMHQHTSTPSTLPSTRPPLPVKFAEAQRNIGALLHTLDAAPLLQRELLASAAAGGDVVQRHLHRLRALYEELGSATTDPPLPSEQYAEMVALYGRVVAAAVTPRFSSQHLPSLKVREQYLEEVAQYVLGHLVVGENDAATLTAMVQRLRESVQVALSLPRPDKGKLAEEDAESKVTRLLPPIMATCFYHVRRHHAEELAWVQTYTGTSDAVACAARVSCPTLSDVPDAMQAFHVCRCAEAAPPCSPISSASCSGPAPAEGVPRLPEPCTTCSYRAVKAVQDAFANPVIGDALRARWAVQQPVHQGLPRSLRMFFLDMVVRQRSRVQGGCAYVPPLHSLQLWNEEGDEEKGKWSMAAWLGCVHQQEAYWVEVLRAFGQWYRLRVLESYGQPEALALLKPAQ